MVRIVFAAKIVVELVIGYFLFDIK